MYRLNVTVLSSAPGCYGWQSRTSMHETVDGAKEAFGKFELRRVRAALVQIRKADRWATVEKLK